MGVLDFDKTKVKKWQPDNLFNTETMLPISEIKNGIVILKDGWLRSIIKVEWLNLDLKNYDEQQVILEQYKRFLNWLASRYLWYHRNIKLTINRDNPIIAKAIKIPTKFHFAFLAQASFSVKNIK